MIPSLWLKWLTPQSKFLPVLSLFPWVLSQGHRSWPDCFFTLPTWLHVHISYSLGYTGVLLSAFSLFQIEVFHTYMHFWCILGGIKRHIPAHHLYFLFHLGIVKRKKKFCGFFQVINVQRILKMPLYAFYTDEVKNCAAATAAAAKSLQSCPTLCDPIDGSPLNVILFLSIVVFLYKVFLSFIVQLWGKDNLRIVSSLFEPFLHQIIRLHSVIIGFPNRCGVGVGKDKGDGVLRTVWPCIMVLKVTL